MNSSSIIIRRFIASDPVPEITDLLHRSYKFLLDMGFRYVATHQDDMETEKRLLKGNSYLALSDNRIIGTISLYCKKEEPESAKFYARKDVVYFGQFAVDPDFQKKGIGNMLLNIIENEAKDHGANEIAFDTAEGAKHLIEFYEKRDYRFIEYVKWEVTNYRSVIMSKKL